MRGQIKMDPAANACDICRCGSLRQAFYGGVFFWVWEFMDDGTTGWHVNTKNRNRRSGMKVSGHAVRWRACACVAWETDSGGL